MNFISDCFIKLTVVCIEINYSFCYYYDCLLNIRKTSTFFVSIQTRNWFFDNTKFSRSSDESYHIITDATRYLIKINAYITLCVFFT